MQRSRYDQEVRASILATSFGAGPIDVAIGQRINCTVNVKNIGSANINVQLHVLYFTHGSTPSGSYDAKGVEVALAPGATNTQYATTAAITSGYFTGTDIDALLDLLNTSDWSILDSLTVEHAVHITTAAPPPPTVSADIVGTPTFTAI